MALRKYIPAAETTVNMKSLSISSKGNEKDQFEDAERSYVEADVNIDIREVYFLIVHFLSAGPCHRTHGQLWNELLEHQLLPRRYHAWYSRSGLCSGDENDDGTSFPLSYNKLVERYSHIEKDHLVKLLKQLIMCTAVPSQGVVGGNAFNAAAVPTLLGTRYFSLLAHDQNKTNNEVKSAPSYMRWPHMLADQVRGLSLREIGGGFSRHHRSPSIRAACYAIAKPSTMVQRMENIKRVRGHRNAVYCAVFDRSGRFVVTGSDDRLVKIWSMETTYCLASCRGHEGDITDLAVSSNNSLVASASNDCIIRVWRLNDGLPISVLRGHTGAVTAIAFSPRPSSVYQLLSSSDDGSCRIWDARYSHLSPRIYIPKPPESVAVKNNGPASSAGQQSHQIFCCAFNASGTVFVTGSSDTFARVWNAAKSTSDDSEHPNHEMDILAGHENDVNYVQFSGCALPFRFSAYDASKEDNIPKFKTTWFNHDNIVTCSRDGSAIIWIPKSRRSHGKVGRWTRAYHLKVPPPPMPPQPPRDGPRQRILPTPRGVNMIAWSLDNRFVLAAIMDCRICVWNAVDGSLVHSLTGHTESTYVLDVHPFNPRIAMSAGYDGKTIVWDIWEGVPIRTYEIGRFKLVDGKFSPDGTSIILSDDVGQLYILNTGQGESQKDAKYDQFFLGDYRPLIQDTHGNVLDQETQLAPYRRNMQDLLCDSGMIPYTDPYQSMYQKHRLGALGIEWRPSSLRFAVGVDISLDQEYQMLPIADLEMLIDPLPVVDVMDWEPEIEVQSDDTDSEYHVTEEYSSGWEQGSLSSNSSGDPECSAEDREVENGQKDVLRRSKRKKQKVEIMTSSGRRVKRKNLNECMDGSLRNNQTRKSKNVRKVSKRKSSLSKSLRPQRAAARNALNLFSRITGTSSDVEDEEGSEGDSSESESTLQESNIGSEESDISLHKGQCEHSKRKEVSFAEPDDRVKAHEYPHTQLNAGNRKKLVLKLPNRDANKSVPSVNATIQHNSQPDVAGPSSTALINNEACNHHPPNLGYTDGDGNIDHMECQTAKIEHHFDLLEGYKNGKIRWGGVKTRTHKRPRMGEFLPLAAYAGSSSCPPDDIEFENPLNGQLTSEKECISTSPASESQGQESEMNKVVRLNQQNIDCGTHKDLDGARDDNEHSVINDHKDYGDPPSQYHKVVDDQAACPVQGSDEIDNLLKCRETSLPVPTKLRIKSKVLSGDHESPMMVRDKSSAEDSKNGTCDTSFSNPSNFELNFNSALPNGTERPSSDNGLNNGVCKVDAHFDASSRSILPEFHNRMYSVVYRRSKLSRGRSDLEGDSYGMEAGTSKRGHHNVEGTDTNVEGGCRTRSKGLRSTSHESNIMSTNAGLREVQDGSEDTSTSVERSSINRFDDLQCEEWRSSSRGAVGLRSTRIRRSNYYSRETSPPDRRKSIQSIGISWLMLSVPEDGCRYIPQMGDEVVYLRQGHQDYIDNGKSKEIAPWKTIKGNIRAVEFCRVADLEYSALSGSGESCCKMTLQFVDPNSSAAGKIFKLTLPEDTGFPDFIVERSRYDAAIQRNWSFRDKCQVWWKNEGEGGSWYDGRIVSVKAKTPEFPDSPWERYVVKYKSYAENQEHSPWELFDADTHWEDPHIDDGIRDKLLHAFTKLQQSGNTARDYYGVQKLRQASQRSNFVNRFPVPLSLELIRLRLQNNYYRSLLAMRHDVRVMLSNAESYFGRSAEFSAKMRHLSDWFERTISSL